MLFRSKKDVAIPIAVFDVSSSSIGGAHALVYRDVATAATLLASARIETGLQEELDMKRFVSSAVQNIEAVAKKLHAADMHAPHHIQLVLASPWYVSQTRTVVYRKDTPVVCTRKLLNEIVEEDIAHMVEHELEKFGGFGKQGTVVEKQISLVKLNGYATSDPIGKRASSIEVFLAVTVAPKKVIEQFTDALSRVYGARKVQITTSTYATFIVARDYLQAGEECMIVDVGEEVTDIGFVKDGLFIYQHSFPVGSYGLYRALVHGEGHTPAEAESLVEGYRLGKVSAKAKATIDKALATFSETWRQALQEVLDAGHFGFCLPELTYITADPRFAGVYPTIIETDPFIQHACSRGPVHSIFISDEQLKAHITSLDEAIDVPLATAALFVGRTV